MQAIVEAWDDIKGDLGGTAAVIERGGRQTIADSKVFASLDTQEGKTEAFRWLAERVNTFVSVVRPRVRSAVADYEENQH